MMESRTVSELESEIIDRLLASDEGLSVDEIAEQMDLSKWLADALVVRLIKRDRVDMDIHATPLRIKAIL